MENNEIAWLREALFEAREQCNNARAEVQRLQSELAKLQSEPDLAQQIGRDTATVNQPLTVRPEPSRLEIAALLLANVPESCVMTIEGALNAADNLIAAAKEGR